MPVDRVLAQGQARCDLIVAETLGDESQHLQLARAQQRPLANGTVSLNGCRAVFFGRGTECSEALPRHTRRTL